MKSNYKKLGDYIREVDERNKDGAVTRLLGVSIEKKFIESIANTIGTDMSTYKIVRKGQFAYGPVTSRNGDKVSIALLEEPECIISSSYSVFEIIDTEKLFPEYLNLWFKRPEFDRYARFHSHGSAREIFDWEEMCNVELPIPEIEEQKKIVEAYNVIERRIALKRQINDNLEATAMALFKSWFITFENTNGNKPTQIADTIIDKLAIEVTDFVANGSFASLRENVNLLDTEDYAYYVRNTDLKSNSYSKYVDKKSYDFLSKSSLSGGEVIISNVADVGSVYLCPKLEKPMTLGSNVIMLRSENNQWSYFMYIYFKYFRGKEQITEITTGSAQPKFNKTAFRNLQLSVPNESMLRQFNNLAIPLFDNIEQNCSEIRYLNKLANTYLETISRR